MQRIKGKAICGQDFISGMSARTDKRIQIKHTLFKVIEILSVIFSSVLIDKSISKIRPGMHSLYVSNVRTFEKFSIYACR